MKALIALKKGSQLIKYSRKGKPKLRPFRISTDETTLIWYSHGEERTPKLASVSRIISGQRTSQRYVANEGKNKMQFAAYRKRRLIWFSLHESKITRLEPVVSKKGLYLPFTSQPHNT
ncbi:PH, RCC1 and FYVE domains-containing protein 1-like isoform X1 [Malus sylvestris]|uniref:PH, RCC1 and FYVE domains-containing protein 1-like isoform X1 n=1 Tax=Malus sylvestris TaxID=3752 RepID=UPI0021ACEED1|nr:PH, RCC1 and FYVE domains-containing protein 1-like isoform X1 [Malus sylvestris]